MPENPWTSLAQTVTLFALNLRKTDTCFTGYVLPCGSQAISKSIWLDLSSRFSELMTFALGFRFLVHTIPSTIDRIRDRLLALEGLEAKTKNITKQLDLIEQLKMAFLLDTFRELD